ncbi:MAG: Gfo/Idh/MocA family oxidoreductase, partial [Chloroflexota bacterium]|nr:Gfo/Idh/MocA family oxidoreductase [Chloroflexota bacterium]
MLRAAVIGCGFMGRQHALAFGASSRAELVAVCDVDPARAEALARELGAGAYGSLDRMLAEARPDLVSVVTPDAHHVEPTLAALVGGCHVLVEKPIALELPDARRMIDAARRAGRVLAVDFNRRFARPYT